MSFALNRALRAVLTVFGVVTAVFFLVRLSGDPVALMLPEQATPAQIAAMRAALGLDRPLFIQYLNFLASAARGDLGISLRQQVPALQLVLGRLPATLELAITAFVAGILLAFLAGLACQIARSQKLRTVLMWAALSRQAIPVFLFGQLLILLFAVELRWLPSVGRSGLKTLVLPAATLATYELGLYLRLFNAALGREFGQDYVRTAYAKGQTRTRIILRHMLPNALLPLITIAGVNLGVLLGGTVVTESVFGWPGVGRLIVQGVEQRDYPVVIAGILVISIIFVLVNFLVDLLYAVLDPRVRLA
jgi:peptide/nickel transport system permease protein